MTSAMVSFSRFGRMGSLVLFMALSAGTLAQAQAPSPLIPTQTTPSVPSQPADPAWLAESSQAAQIPALLRPAGSVPVSQEEPKATKKDDASHQGITVHGHWIIDVRNPDGTLAEHRDFENSLVGANTMVGLLYGNYVTSDFMVYLTGTTPPCNVTAGNYCDIVHNLSVAPALYRCGGVDYCVTGLTITPTFGDSPALVFAGNMTATQAGSISTVGTMQGLCGNSNGTLTTVSPSSCNAGNSPYGYGALTQTGITAIAIISGQIIQVTVTITFS
jgi:hypothetical protein